MAWPKYFPWPTPSQFVAHNWCELPGEVEDALSAHDIDVGELPTSEVREILKMNSCGSKLCLAGWVRDAFGLPANPEYGKDLPPQGDKILRRVLYELGQNGDILSGRELCGKVAAAMDGTEGSSPKEVSPRRASDIMRRVLAHFGYTEAQCDKWI